MKLRNEITEYLDNSLSESCYEIAKRHERWNTLIPSNKEEVLFIYFPGKNRGEVILTKEGTVRRIHIYRVKKPFISCYSVKERKLNQSLNKKFRGIKIERVSKVANAS